MGKVNTYTDDQIEELLIQHNGQPTKVAAALKVSYSHLYRRIRANPELYEVQKAHRQKTFQDVSNFIVSAVLAGIMKSPSYSEDGEILRDANDKIIYREIIVDEKTRMDHASRLMNIFKGDEGIKEEIKIGGFETITGIMLVDD